MAAGQNSAEFAQYMFVISDYFAEVGGTYATDFKGPNHC